MKGHHSADRDHHCFARGRIPPLASALVSDCKLTKAGDDNGSARLKGGLEEFQNPLQQPHCFFVRDPSLLMNSCGNINLCMALSL